MHAKSKHDAADRAGEPATLDQRVSEAEGGLESGIVRATGDLPSGAIITEKGLAAILGKHPCSIRRAVDRGELPPPARLMGKPSWTAGVIVRHIEKRLELAAEEADILTNHLM